MAFLKFLRMKMRRKRCSLDGLSDGDRAADCDGRRSFSGNQPLRRNGDSYHEIEDGGSARRFSSAEIQKLTSNFSRVIGSGGFSTVYLAQFPDSSLGAIKIHNSGSDRLTRVHQQELEILLHIRHRNIVEFLGYCDDGEHAGLVFEYIPQGNLQEKLHHCAVLPWRNRIAIAFQLAEAIEYLHEKCALQVVHGDVKASNVLLDEQLNCKLCDFGSAKMGFSSTVLLPTTKQLMLGSPGYADPHYLRTGIASKKNDIYSFGVVVLELITGMEAFSEERGQMLTSIAEAALRDREVPDATDLAAMVDPRLDGEFDLEEATVMASIAALCVYPAPSLRPSAADILFSMKEKISSLSFGFPADKKVTCMIPPHRTEFTVNIENNNNLRSDRFL